MKALRYFFMPAVIPNNLTLSLHANASAYLKSSGAAKTIQTTSVVDNFFRFMFSLLMFFLILVVAYYVTKFLAKKSSVKTKSKNMKVVEMLPLGVDKSVMLVKVGQQYVLLGNVPKSMVFLSAFDADKLGIKDASEEVSEYEDSFDSYLDSYNINSGQSMFNSEENYITSVKKNLNKLKSMVRGSKSNE